MNTFALGLIVIGLIALAMIVVALVAKKQSSATEPSEVQKNWDAILTTVRKTASYSSVSELAMEYVFLAMVDLTVEMHPQASSSFGLVLRRGFIANLVVAFEDASGRILSEDELKKLDAMLQYRGDGHKQYPYGEIKN